MAAAGAQPKGANHFKIGVPRRSRARICRHVVYWLAHGDYERQIEAIGCREPDGRWSLSG